MSASYAAAATTPKDRLAQSFGANRTVVRFVDGIIATVKDLYPRKPTTHVAALCGVSTRAVEHWFSGRRDPSADALVAMLRSEIGGQVLAAIMGDAKPKWWTRHRRTVSLAALRKAQEEQRILIERMERESAE